MEAVAGLYNSSMNSNRATSRDRLQSRPVQRGGRRSNTLRIVAGTLRGRTLAFPDAEGLRPTPDRVRETLFNWLGQDLTAQTCLDLFAGSGALGFEALSRNARRVVFVESQPAVAAAIRASAERLRATECGDWALERRDALEFLRLDRAERYDVVFLDPPFGAGWLERVLPRLPGRLAPDALVYVESAALPAFAGWRIVKQSRAGAVHFALLQYDQTTGAP